MPRSALKVTVGGGGWWLNLRLVFSLGPKLNNMRPFENKIIILQGDSWKLIFLIVLLLSIYRHMGDLIILKILLIGFHFDNRDKKVSNLL